MYRGLRRSLPVASYLSYVLDKMKFPVLLHSAVGGVVHLEPDTVPAEAVQLVQTTDRDAVGQLIAMPQIVDVIIPRGGKGLIERISRDEREIDNQYREDELRHAELQTTLNGLSEQCQETVNLLEPDGTDLLYVARLPRHEIRYPAGVIGAVAPRIGIGAKFTGNP